MAEEQRLVAIDGERVYWGVSCLILLLLYQIDYLLVK